MKLEPIDPETALELSIAEMKLSRTTLSGATFAIPKSKQCRFSH
jgi:hypothetical protein